MCLFRNEHPFHTESETTSWLQDSESIVFNPEAELMLLQFNLTVCKYLQSKPACIVSLCCQFCGADFTLREKLM